MWPSPVDESTRQARLEIQREKMRKAILWGKQEASKKKNSALRSTIGLLDKESKQSGIVINGPRRMLAIRNGISKKSTAASIAASRMSSIKKIRATSTLYSKPNKIAKASPARVKKQPHQRLSTMTAMIGNATTTTSIQRRQSLRLKARHHKMMMMMMSRGGKASKLNEQKEEEKTLFVDPTVPPFAEHEKFPSIFATTSASTASTLTAMMQATPTPRKESHVFLQQQQQQIVPKHLFGSPAPVPVVQQQQQQQKNLQRHGYTSSSAAVAAFAPQTEEMDSIVTKIDDSIMDEIKPAAPSSFTDEEKKSEPITTYITVSKVVVATMAGTTVSKKEHGTLQQPTKIPETTEPTSQVSMTGENPVAVIAKNCTIVAMSSNTGLSSSAIKEGTQAAIMNDTKSSLAMNSIRADAQENSTSTNVQATTPPKRLTKAMPSISASPSIGALEPSSLNMNSKQTIARTTTKEGSLEKYEQEPKLAAISEDQDDEEEFAGEWFVQNESTIGKKERSLGNKTFVKSTSLKWAASVIAIIVVIVFFAGFSKGSRQVTIDSDVMSQYEEFPTSYVTNQMLDEQIEMQLGEL